MAGGVFYAINQRLGRVFPERRVYVRSDAQTRYWTLNPISQAGTAIVLLSLVGWTGFTSMAFIDKAMDGRTVENQLEVSKEAYEIQLAALRDQQRLLEQELNRSNRRGDAVTSELSGKQRLLIDTATQLSAAEAELSGLRSEFQRLVAQRQAEQDEINLLNDQVIALQLSLADEVRSNHDATETLRTLASTMNGVIADRDMAKDRGEALDLRVATLESEISDWSMRHQTLVARLEDATKTSLASLSDLFVGSEVKLDSILKQAARDYTGRGGGPIENESEERSDAGQEALPGDGERVAALMSDLERMSLMRVAIDRLPFGFPTKGARLTSSFGPRRDPLRRSYRMHNGIDFAAPRGTPIYATGEGVVSFSGRQRGYGIVVKIRHAFGFETVYAHLNKSRVKVGQRVSRDQRIADMGSTGRSTGSHLHYEIRIDGKPVNPNKFIKAARNVL